MWTTSVLPETPRVSEKHFWKVGPDANVSMEMQS